MDWKNQLTKTPYLVLFIVLISIGVGTASALITITLAGNVVVTGNLDVIGPITSPTVDDLQDKISQISLPSQVIVSIQESGVPGCEENSTCVSPFEVRIAIGGEVTWNNDSPVSHYLVSGTPADGPTGEFDSGIISAGNSFAHTFNQVGVFPYFDLVHPWTTGVVIVRELPAIDIEINVREQKSDEMLIEPGLAGIATATCNSGEKVTGGGFETDGSVPLEPQVLLSRPHGNGWSVALENLSGNLDLKLTAIAMCSSLTP